MKMINYSLLMNALASMWMKHPISLGSLLMIQSISTSILTIILTKNSWYSMILFITFSSGLMIMFMYMSSISSNEKFSWSTKISGFLILSLTMICLIKMDKIFIFNHNWMEKKIYFMENEEIKSIYKNLNSNKFFIFTLVTLLILISLISVSNLISSFEGPLKMTYENQL
uniref:NADH dehydrogenase subunit 6 n=1 Tax=Sogatella furcifera TaxID=113103 RepID=M9Q2M1_SOGFU|nr:NADH dehydrogenase subunit 6 [Sogatella furcifera]AGH29096.1 NADH dehydrogenase subunit 6 [Sogatella furcifera]AGH29108.1 NADH dehydrogenase subunit 6 [Sogatella furcifera]QVO59331.1 NADH dehydrogenase subunit 6 [Sogatella furcifera]UXN45377.1 NADH dehydrogenase subunit 6 [Sogatella furcifera]UXN45390.1 NADH dehydrogenase subunit 6 [Sogatella furcifera]